MCPFCVTTATLVVTGTASGSGLAAVIVWIRARTGALRSVPAAKTKEN